MAVEVKGLPPLLKKSKVWTDRAPVYDVADNSTGEVFINGMKFGDYKIFGYQVYMGLATMSFRVNINKDLAGKSGIKLLSDEEGFLEVLGYDIGTIYPKSATVAVDTGYRGYPVKRNGDANIRDLLIENMITQESYNVASSSVIIAANLEYIKPEFIRG